MSEPQLPLASGETLIVYTLPCDHLRPCDEDVHQHVHIDGYCPVVRAPGPLPTHTVRHGHWTESNCIECRLFYRKAVFGETVVPAHKPGGAT